MARTSLPRPRPSVGSSWKGTGAFWATAFLSAKRPECVLQGGVLALIVVFRAEVLDLRGGHVQLPLCKFHYRGKAQVVTALREVQRQRGLAQQLGARRW